MNYDPTDLFFKVPFKEITLQKLHVTAEKVMSATLLISRSSYTKTESEFHGALVYRLMSFVWADAPKQIKVSYPSTWWQHFKQRWFPKWVLKKWPVKLTIKIMEAQHYYPNLPQTCPENLAQIRMVIRE